jgi:hypothetical protein
MSQDNLQITRRCRLPSKVVFTDPFYFVWMYTGLSEIDSEHPFIA